jgi:hypothetical protein
MTNDAQRRVREAVQAAARRAAEEATRAAREMVDAVEHQNRLFEQMRAAKRKMDS